ncbi:MAG: ABC transporter ATP-binding protein [Candidatus Heimdallarchaeota archaeon]|nr:ABC transporter ATP-binding protein [Candidatus Heimdallarchaeota archaeon]
METENFIYVSNVTRYFRDPDTELNVMVLRGIDLKLKRGSFSAIIGPSGAGKTTLLSILGGMIRPSTGQVFVDGIPLHRLSENELNNYRRRYCGFLWQDAEMNLQIGLTVEQNIKHAMNIASYPRELRTARIKELGKKLGMTPRLKHRFDQLSGGEAIRASLAVALANSPELLLLDEPTGELDSETTLEMITYLRKMNEEGTTVIVVTHDTRFERMTDQSFYLLDGSIIKVRKAEGNSQGWKEAVREEYTVINQFGQIQIPLSMRSKFKFNEFLRLVEDDKAERLYLEKVDKDMSICPHCQVETSIHSEFCDSCRGKLVSS